MSTYEEHFARLKSYIAPEGLWVFAYGSLMWRPGFSVVHNEAAQLYGYCRKLCLYSHHYRGTPDVPGVVFGLERGGSCVGRALCVAHAHIDTVLQYIFDREMVTDAYYPRMVQVRFLSPQSHFYQRTPRRRALCFVIRHDHPQYAGSLTCADTCALIRQGVGKGGTCLDYVRETAEHLKEYDICDPALEQIVRRLDGDM